MKKLGEDVDEALLEVEKQNNFEGNKVTVTKADALKRAATEKQVELDYYHQENVTSR